MTYVDFCVKIINKVKIGDEYVKRSIWSRIKNYCTTNNIFNRHTILWSWICSYILILSVPITANLISNVRVSHIIKEDNFVSNKMRLEILRDKTDIFFKDSERIASEIMGDDNVARLSQASIADGSTRYEAIAIGDMFQRQMFSSTQQISGYLYFPKMNMILSHNSLIDSKTFYDTYYSKSNLSYNEWMAHFASRGRSLYATNTTYDNDSGGDVIENIRELWLVGKGSEERVIVTTLISSDVLFRDLTDNTQNTSILVLDEKKQVLINRGQNYESDFFSHMQFDKNHSTAEFKYNSQKLIASCIESKWNGMQYVYIIESAKFNSEMAAIWHIMIMWILVAILIGAFIIVVAVNNNYRPLKGLMNTLKKMRSFNDSNDKNEYSMIKNVIKELTEGNNLKDNELRKQNDNLQNIYLSNIIEGKSIEHIEQKLSNIGIVFREKVFYIALVHIDVLGNFADENYDYDYNEKLAIYALSNIIEEIIGKYFAINICVINNIMVCVVNTNEQQKNEHILKEELTKAQDIIGYYLDTIISIAMSGRGNDIHDLHRLYNEAIQAEEYRNILGGEGVISYVEIENDIRLSHGYSQAKWRAWVNAVDSGDAITSQRMLDEIIKCDFEDNHSSNRIKKGMACILISMMVELEASEFDFMNQCAERMEKIIHDFSVPEFKNVIQYLSGLILEYRKNENENAPTLSENIKAYIDENYQNYNLNVSLIGQEFNMTATYLSKIFNEQTGVKLLDYINIYRVDKAKELLIKYPDMKVEAIGEMVGFAVNRTFLRTFKKYEGVSPSIYKEQDIR